MTTLTVFTIAPILMGGYLVGSIPFGLILCFLCGFGDIREIGSGNIGATNVLRASNKILALLTLVFDAGKGGLCAFLVLYYTHDPTLSVWVGLTVTIGHNFPVWLGFRGGKGVATTFGVLTFTAPYIALVVIGVWMVTIWVSRVSSLAALVALPIAPILSIFLTNKSIFFPFLTLTLLAYVRHKDNIKRLAKRKEPKIVLKL